MSSPFNLPPTYVEGEMRDAEGKFIATNPLWLRWYLDLAQYLESIDDAQRVIVNQVFGA